MSAKLTNLKFDLSDEAIERLGRDLKPQVERFIRLYYGRCPEYSEGCSACQAWKGLEAIFGEL